MKIKLIILINLLSTLHVCNSQDTKYGDFVALGELPYQVSIQEVFNLGRVRAHYCGGAILGDKWILTTAHCADKVNNPYQITNFVVAVAKLFSLINEPHQQLRGIKRVYIYDKYVHIHVRLISPYDIALLKLNESLIFNNQISPIALPKADTKLGKKAIVSGWNFIHNRDMRQYSLLPWLKVTNIDILDNKTCLQIVEKINNENDNIIPKSLIEKHIICGGPLVSATTVCIGDSGGPLVKQKRFKKRRIVGLLSYVQRLYFPGLSYLEGISVYIKVSPYVSWIKSIMNNEG